LARDAIDKALAIEPDLATAHAHYGYLAMTYDGDLATAARHIDRALSLAPEDLGVALDAARLAQTLGRLDQAIAFDRYVVARDPVNPRAHYNLGVDYFYARRPDEAIAHWQTAVGLSPDFIGARYNIGMALLLKGDKAGAMGAIEQEPSDPWRAIGLPMVYHAMGRKAESDAALANLIRDYDRDAAYNIAYVLAWRGEADHAFEWLDKAVANHDSGLTDVEVEPEFASLHRDPRWPKFLRRLGKAPEQLAAIRFDAMPPGAKP
jgi:tetratricopeptide (TPR) repeat protein